MHGWPRTEDTIIELVAGDLTQKVIGVCIEVSRELGGGFLENVYLRSMMIALPQAGRQVAEQEPLKISFRGQVVGGYYPDLIGEGRLIVELKAVKMLRAEHESQLMHYLKATGMKIGLLVNFGRSKVEWKRMVH